jgi:cobalt/nickel transport system permease protein
MHIPDGFLSTPVWSALDAVAIPTVIWAARKAQNDVDAHGGRRIPLLGVMGAFVFAAQMINFPVGMGTSGHLVGGTLLAVTLGPAAAVIVMTAILILQALIFQDGGILVLGANIFNMAVAGVLVGYLPYRLAGRGAMRSRALFSGGLLSVGVSAALALVELRISGVPLPRNMLWISAGFFAVSAVIEGAITVAAARAIQRLNPMWIQEAPAIRTRSKFVLLFAVAVLATAGFTLASPAPDALQNLLREAATEPGSWIRRAVAGLGGMTLVYAICTLVERRIQRSA